MTKWTIVHYNRNMIRSHFNITVLLLSLFALSGCTGLGLITGAAAVTGIAAAQEGGLSRAFSDSKIKVNINEAWFQYNVDAFRKLGTTVEQGRVLITGIVQDPQHRVEAVRLAWRVAGVTQVINEIRVEEGGGVTGYVKDSWITSRLRTSLTFNRGVQGVNYSIDTVKGVVYLMGVAQNQAELNLVIESARTIAGVKKVVSYVKMAGEPSKGQVQNQVETGMPQNLETGRQGHQSRLETNANWETDAQRSTLDIDTPTYSVPEDAPSIEEQYYHND